MRAVALDVRDRSVDAVDDAGGDDRVEIFGAQSSSRRRLHARVGACAAASPRTSQPASISMVDQRLEIVAGAGAIDQQRLGGAADAGAAHLRVQHDGLRHGELGGAVHIDVTRRLRDARTPARALRSARVRPGSCRRAARSRRWRRRAPRASCPRRRGRASARAQWRPPAGRLRQALRPARAWIARVERKLSEPPRRITALPAFRHNTPASAVTFGRLS